MFGEGDNYYHICQQHCSALIKGYSAHNQMTKKLFLALFMEKKTFCEIIVGVCGAKKTNSFLAS